MLFLDKKLHIKLKDIFGFDGTYLRDFIKVSLPVMISGFLWGLSQSAETAILGHLSATVIAASSIATVVSQLFKAVGSASVTACSVTMGKVVGRGSLEHVRPYARTQQCILIGIGLLTGGALFLSHNMIVSFYTVSPEAKALAASFMVILSVSLVGTCYEYPVEGGIIAGGGNPRYQAYADNLFMWLFTIPCAAVAAYVFNASPVVVYCILKADQLLKCIPNAIFCNRYGWVRNLTR